MVISPATRPAARWLMLGLGVAAQAATCAFIYGAPLLIPALRHDEGVSLLAASVVVSAPMAGVLLTLIAWGAVADRHGERIVMALGLGLSAAVLVVASVVHGTVGLAVTLGVAGAAGASVNAASGRMVMGWFPQRQRGVAMGARQTAQPLGVAIGALSLPPLAQRVGVGEALLLPAVLCAVVGIAVVVLAVDPPRPRGDVNGDAPSPYRRSLLWRIHAASALLVVPQFAVASFTLAYLVAERHWDASVAGRLIFWFQVSGAVGRVAAGAWSDAVASRLRPMRQLAVASAATMVVLAAGAAEHSGWIVAGFALGALVTVADNGLAYTAVAEHAGLAWTGRALGVQNTGQNLVALLTAPALALVIGDGRYALAFGLAALFPLLAVPVTPVRAERSAARRRELISSALWRRMRDLNPRGVAPNSLSKRAP